MSEDYDGDEEEDIKQTVERFELMLKQNAQYYFDVEQYEDIIDYYFDKNQINTALDVVNIASKQHPDSTLLLLKKAQIYTLKDNTNHALEIISTIEPMESDNSDLILLKATIFSQLGRADDAITEYTKLIDNNDDSIEMDELLLLIAIEFENKSDYNSAAKFLERALMINHSNQMLLDEIKYVYSILQENERSIKFFTKLIDKEPYNKELWFNLGTLYDELELFEKAVDSYDYALAIDGEYISAMFAKADTLVMMEKYEGAIEIYHELIGFKEVSANLYYLVADSYDKMDDYDQAIKYYNLCLDLDSEYSDSWFSIGLIKYYQNDYIESMHYVKRAISIEEGNPAFLLLLANIQHKLGLNEEAFYTFATTLEMDNDNLDVWLDFAEFHYNCENFTECINLLKEGIIKHPDFVEFYYCLAGYLLAIAKHKDALSYLERALALNFEKHVEFLESFPIVLEDPEFVNLISLFKEKKR